MSYHLIIKGPMKSTGSLQNIWWPFYTKVSYHISIRVPIPRKYSHKTDIPSHKCIWDVQDIWTYQHIVVWTKWRTFCTRHIQMHFRDRPCAILIKISLNFVQTCSVSVLTRSFHPFQAFSLKYRYAHITTENVSSFSDGGISVEQELITANNWTICINMQHYFRRLFVVRVNSTSRVVSNLGIFRLLSLPRQLNFVLYFCMHTAC